VDAREPEAVRGIASRRAEAAGIFAASIGAMGVIVVVTVCVPRRPHRCGRRTDDCA
jgi:hypothetical protein